MVVFAQSGYILAKVVVVGQKWLPSGKSGCIRVRMMYLGRVVVLLQKWLYSGKNGCTRAKWLYSGKVVVFGQSGCF